MFQARWFVQVLQGNMQLPSYDEMMVKINKTAKNLSMRYKQTIRYTLEVGWQAYMDDICQDFGARPNMFRLLITDPKLYLYCMFGPILPYQFRLYGPYAWTGAREAIMNVDERVRKPFMTNVDDADEKNSTYFIGVILLLPVVAFVGFMIYY